MLERPWRFNELQKSLGASQKSPTEALLSLEDDDIVHRKVYPEIPPKVEYSLTKLGQSMKPILVEMQKWGNYYKSQQGKSL